MEGVAEAVRPENETALENKLKRRTSHSMEEMNSDLLVQLKDTVGMFVQLWVVVLAQVIQPNY